MESSAERQQRFLYALSEQRTAATLPSGAVTVEVTADGTIHSVELTDHARRVSADQLVSIVVDLHRKALERARATLRESMDLLNDQPESVEPTRLPAADRNIDDYRSPRIFEDPLARRR